MSEQKLPAEISEQLTNLSTERLNTLENKLAYSPDKLTSDIEAHYNQLLTNNADNATEKLENQLTRFFTALDEITLNDAPPKQTYNTLLEAAKNQAQSSQLVNGLANERKTLVASISDLKRENPHKEDYENAYHQGAYGYLAAEKGLLAPHIDNVIGDSAIFQFSHSSVKNTFDTALNKAGPEGKSVFEAHQKIIQNTLNEKTDFIAKDKKSPDNQTIITGLDNIISHLKGSLSPDGQAVKYFESGLRQRFSNLPNPNKISINEDSLNDMVGEIFTTINNGAENPADITKLIDKTANHIYHNAEFEKSHRLQVDFKRQMGKEVQKASDHLRESFGMNSKIAAAGLGISMVASLAGRSGTSDGIESQHAQSEEQRKSLHKKRNRKLAFATVASVAGTMVLLDGLLFKGKHTKKILDGAKNALTGPSKSL